MIGFLKGSVEIISSETITIDVNGVGYELFVANPEKFTLYKNTLVYTYLKISENDVSFYGFPLKEEKDLFLQLISVKGIGPKSAMSMLSRADYSYIIEDIEVGNLSYLKKLPGIGPKAAQQIILDLKGHLKTDVRLMQKEDTSFVEARNALKGYGFKVNEIDNALSKINETNLSVDQVILKALQLLNTK